MENDLIVNHRIDIRELAAQISADGLDKIGKAVVGGKETFLNLFPRSPKNLNPLILRAMG
ncbi:MAG: hypothetical protein ACI87W_000524 [Halieaceae bacterium]